MSPSKLAAQVSHASMAFLSHLNFEGGLQKVVSPDTGEMERSGIIITWAHGTCVNFAFICSIIFTAVHYRQLHCGGHPYRSCDGHRV